MAWIGSNMCGEGQYQAPRSKTWRHCICYCWFHRSRSSVVHKWSFTFSPQKRTVVCACGLCDANIMGKKINLSAQWKETLSEDTKENLSKQPTATIQSLQLWHKNTMLKVATNSVVGVKAKRKCKWYFSGQLFFALLTLIKACKIP